MADSTVTYYTGQTGKLFECNAVLNTNKKILDNIKTILRGMRGLLPYVQGKFKLIIESTGTAAISLSEDNIIGGISVESERKDQKYNRVLVNFVNPLKNYQADTIVYDTDHATLKTADGGFLQEGNITLDTINSPYQAHEFGKIVLQRSRNNLKLGLTTNYETLDLAIGDIVNVSSTILGMNNKAFRVSGMTLNANFTAALSLQEHQDSWYTFTTISEQDTIGDTSFPDPFTVQPPASVTLDDELIQYNDGTVIVAMNITIGASPDQFVREYQVEYKRTSDANFIVHSKGTVDLFHRVLNVISGDNYTVRVKAINSLGVESTSVSATRDIVGEIAPPSDVEDFSINIVGSDAHLSWKSIPDADLNYYVLNFTTETVNPEWQKLISYCCKNI